MASGRQPQPAAPQRRRRERQLLAQGPLPSRRLRKQVLRAFEAGREAARPPVPDAVDRLRCRECRGRNCVVDERHGAVVCTDCGVEVDRLLRDATLGAGAAQYTPDGTKDSAELDRILRERAVGATTKAYKARLQRRARHDLITLCDRDNLADLAAEMFRNYSATREKVVHYSSVLQACVVNAERSIRQRHPAHARFPCDACGHDFDCKKDRRFHRCATPASAPPTPANAALAAPLGPHALGRGPAQALPDPSRPPKAASASGRASDLLPVRSPSPGLVGRPETPPHGMTSGAWSVATDLSSPLPFLADLEAPAPNDAEDVAGCAAAGAKAGSLDAAGRPAEATLATPAPRSSPALKRKPLAFSTKVVRRPKRKRL